MTRLSRLRIELRGEPSLHRALWKPVVILNAAALNAPREAGHSPAYLCASIGTIAASLHILRSLRPVRNGQGNPWQSRLNPGSAFSRLTCSPSSSGFTVGLAPHVLPGRMFEVSTFGRMHMPEKLTGSRNITLQPKHS